MQHSRTNLNMGQTSLTNHLTVTANQVLIPPMSWLPSGGARLSNADTEYTQKNGADSIVKTIETAPFFCVYPVLILHGHLNMTTSI